MTELEAVEQWLQRLEHPMKAHLDEVRPFGTCNGDLFAERIGYEEVLAAKDGEKQFNGNISAVQSALAFAQRQKERWQKVSWPRCRDLRLYVRRPR